MKFGFPFVSHRHTCGVIAGALAVVVAGLGVSAHAAETTANATATVVRPITITKVNDLRFGAFSTSASGQTVQITTAGARTLTGALGVTSTVGAASFTVAGEGGLTYAISLPSTTVTIQTDDGGAGETMAVTAFTSNPLGTGTLSGTLGGAGNQTLSVGATLTTVASQVAGNYTGSFTVAVDYN
jgi:hypothetical protein